MSKLKLLIVEDEKDLRDIYKLIFDPIENIEPKIVGTSDEGASLVASTQFDCIILDIMLPGGINGLELAKRVRDENLNRTTPIYIVSGNLDDDAIVTARNLSVVESLRKPFKRNELVAKIVDTMQSKRTYDIINSTVVNLCINAAADTFEYYFKEKLLIGRPKIKSSDESVKSHITGLISITGNGFMGSLALCCSRFFVEKLTEAFFPEGNIEVDQRMVMDVIAETSNQIIGRVKSEFTKLGQDTAIGLPQVISGENHSVFHKTAGPVVHLQIGSGELSCELEFCFSRMDMKLDIKKKDEDASIDSGDMVFFD